MNGTARRCIAEARGWLFDLDGVLTPTDAPLVRATLEVPARIDAAQLEALARADERVDRSLAGREITRAVVRPPKVVSFSTH